MTNEQATKVLKRIQYGTTYPVYEALDMAIEALNFVSEHHQSNIETYAHDMGVSLEQAERELRVEELSCSEEPNRSDLISRTRLLTDLQETVEAWSKYPVMEEEIKGVEMAIGYVKNIPSANIDLSGFCDRLWKSAYDRGYERCRQDAIDALKRLQKDISGDYTELDPMVMAGCGYIGDCIGEIQDLPSAQPEREDEGRTGVSGV